MWVPIAVGIIGLVGVLGTQLFAARREDQRWRRDLHREDLRWQRERERERERRDHDVALQLHSRQISCYGQFAGAVNAWNAELIRAADIVRSAAATDHLRTRLRELRQLAEESLATMEIVGSESVRQAGRKAVDALNELESVLVGRDGTNRPTADEFAQRTDRVFQECQRFRQQIRHDLKLVDG